MYLRITERRNRDGSTVGHRGAPKALQQSQQKHDSAIAGGLTLVVGKIAQDPNT
jgi:hypothetical protein